MERSNSECSIAILVLSIRIFSIKPFNCFRIFLPTFEAWANRMRPRASEASNKEVQLGIFPSLLNAHLGSPRPSCPSVMLQQREANKAAG